MLAIFFDTPELLLTLLAIPACVGFLLYAYWRRRQMMVQLGSALLLRRSVQLKPRVRRWKAIALLVALALIALASAGPQWGIDKTAQIRKGRDVFIVFDLSRSMLAEQPNRRAIAVRSLRHLADALETHGGHRVALIGFASQARLFFPLTQDCDHLRHTLAQIDVGDFPSLSRDEPISGTRIGAALKLACSYSEPQRANRPVIVLLSDGDDPADDQEWLAGVAEVEAKRIRVHVVGIGDPKNAETIPFGRDVLSYDGMPILTKLNEERLREIAAQTGGQYLPAHGSAIELGAYVQYLLDADELREEVPSDDAPPVLQLRYAWFLLPAVLLLLVALSLSEGPTSKKETPIMKPKTRSKALVAQLVLFAIVTVSAADPLDADALVREGNQAFAAKQYERALKLYEDAEPLTRDPGLIAFNKAAAYYRLERYKDAIDAYRRAVEDDRAPPERKARMYFDLGNALAQHAGERAAPLAEAVANYRKCLYQPNLPDSLRRDARHNLELAQLRWLKAKEQEPAEAKSPEAPPKKDPLDEKDAKKSAEMYVPVDPEKKQKQQASDDVPKGQNSDKVRSEGSISVLPDEQVVQAISPEDAASTLDAHARRIAAERRQLRGPTGPATLTTKDW
jgi:Ca-activated chloride channel family protein